MWYEQLSEFTCCGHSQLFRCIKKYHLWQWFSITSVRVKSYAPIVGLIEVCVHPLSMLTPALSVSGSLAARCIIFIKSSSWVSTTLIRTSLDMTTIRMTPRNTDTVDKLRAYWKEPFIKGIRVSGESSQLLIFYLPLPSLSILCLCLLRGWIRDDRASVQAFSEGEKEGGRKGGSSGLTESLTHDDLTGLI